MKKTNRLLMFVLCIALVLCSVVALTACSQKHVCEHVCNICKKCLDKNCQDPVCAEKCKGHGGNKPGDAHVCKHVCPVCKGCLDLECKDPVCAKKCGEGKTSYALDPLDNRVEKGGVCSIMKEGELKYVGNFASMYSSSLRFTFNSDKDGVATLVLNIGKRSIKNVYTDSVTVLFNDEIVDSPAEVPIANDTTSWTEFTDLVLGCVQVKEGANTLELIPTDSNLEKIYNFRNAKLLGDMTVELAAHECHSKCDVCGGCKNVLCAQDVNCVEKCTCSPYTIFSVVDDEVVVEGNTKNMGEGIVGVKIGEKVTITFRINVPTAGKYSLQTMVSSNGTPVPYTSVYKLTINGQAIETTAEMPVGAMFGDYKDVVLGEYDFAQGLNTIVIESNATGDSNTWYNVRSIGIGLKGCTYYNEEQTEHVCNHVCPICGGCTDEACLDPVCATKCTCAALPDNKFPVADDKVAVSGTSKSGEGVVGVQVDGTVVTIRYEINSDKAAKAVLKIETSANGAPTKKATELYVTTVNGAAFASDATLPVGSQFADYQVTVLGMIDLVEGKNVIEFSIVGSMDGATWYNFKAMTLATEATVSYYVQPIEGTQFSAVDDKVVVSGVGKNMSEGVVGVDVNGGTVTIRFEINADKAGKAVLKIEASANGAPTKKATDLYVTTVNGAAFTSDATLPEGQQFKDYQVVTLGEIDLVEGKNVIEFSVVGSMDSSTWYNFKTMILETTSTVTFA